MEGAIMPPDYVDSTIRLPACSVPAKAIDLHQKSGRNGKKKPCYTRPTSRVGQGWKHIIDGNGDLRPVTCPKCSSLIRYGKQTDITCHTCGWIPSKKEREALDAKDPEMIPVRKFHKEMEKFAPTFEGHANLKRISGKERRDKRFLSKCAAVG